jgi:hypothetical protein
MTMHEPHRAHREDVKVEQHIAGRAARRRAASLDALGEALRHELQVPPAVSEVKASSTGAVPMFPPREER